MNGYNDIVKFKFGKYKNESIVDVVEKDLNYCNWLISQNEFKKKNPIIFELMIDNGVSFDKNFAKKRELTIKRKSEYFTFGKYKDHNITETYNKDKNYCEYIISLSNVVKYHKPTVDKINELIELDLQ